MNFIPRDYQHGARSAIMQEFVDHDSTLLILPTGMGKTCVFAMLIEKNLPQRAMVLAHRSELIFQAQQKIEAIAGVECAVEMADLYAGETMFSKCSVVVSTVQTQASGPKDKERMRRFDPMSFSLLIIDEAHHSAARSYCKIIEYYRRNPNLKVLGVTATPDRTDELALGEIFETVAFDYEIIDAINNGYLVPIDQQFVTVGDLDFSAVRTTAGDLNGSDLAALMESERTMQEIAAASLQIVGDKRTLVFTASVVQAETLCNIFNRHRSGMASWVCGKTDKEHRRQILSDFSAGKIQVVVNCAVLTEGFDSPGVEIVIMARPTKSRSLYSQMVGRGTRTLTGLIDGVELPEERKRLIAESAKKSLLVVDFVGNSGRHKLMTSADILGGKSSEEAIEIAIESAKKKGGRVSMSVEIDEAEAEIRRVRLEAQERARIQEEARKARLVAKAKFTMNSVDPFDRYQVRCQPPNSWDRQAGRILTEKQRNIVKMIGVDPDAVSFSCAKQLIGAYFEKPSPKQIMVLTRAGYDCAGMTRKDASAKIDTLANNGWRKPE